MLFFFFHRTGQLLKTEAAPWLWVLLGEEISQGNTLERQPVKKLGLFPGNKIKVPGKGVQCWGLRGGPQRTTLGQFRTFLPPTLALTSRLVLGSAGRTQL